jgi:hypothetical protein
MLSLLLAVVSDLLLEESSSNFWCLAFLYLVLLGLLVCAVEVRQEAVAIDRSSSDDFLSRKTALRRVEYSMESLASDDVALEARISTRFIPTRLEKLDSDYLSSQHLEDVRQNLLPEISRVAGSSTIQQGVVIPTVNFFYAVLKGRQPGIYLSWHDCKNQVDGYSGARYKGFQTRGEAEEFLGWKRK